MNISRCLTALTVAMTLFVACKKSSEDRSIDTEPPKVVVKHLSRVIHTVGTTTDLTDYTYDVKKRLSTVKSGGNLTISYTYSGDDLFAIDARFVNGTNVARNYYEFAYTGGVLKSSVRRIYANDVLSREYTFDHTIVNGQVTKTVQNPGTIITDYTYYTNGDLASVAAGGNTTVYTYDDHKSIFSNALAKYVTPGESSDRFSKNVVIKSAPATGGTATHFTYTYDADGYPITMVSGQDKYSYQYVVL